MWSLQKTKVENRKIKKSLSSYIVIIIDLIKTVQISSLYKNLLAHMFGTHNENSNRKKYLIIDILSQYLKLCT